MALFDKKQFDKSKDITDLINKRRRQILIHSAIYYKFNSNLIQDDVFDKWCRELVSLHAKYPKESSKCVFHQEFKKWTGFSGYDLLEGAGGYWATLKAQQLLEYRKLL